MPTQLTGIILAAHAIYRETIMRICLNSLTSQWEIETTTFHYFIVFLLLRNSDDFLIYLHSSYFGHFWGTCFKYKATQRTRYSVWKSNTNCLICLILLSCHSSPFLYTLLCPTTYHPNSQLKETELLQKLFFSYSSFKKYDCSSQKDPKPYFKPYV